MKTKLFLFALLATFALSVSAQSDDYQNYLNKALSSLENGNCDAAKKWYDVYKELTGKTVSSVEVLIQDCKPTSSAKKYAINDKIEIDGFLYRVAYIEDDGAHGFAIYDFGAGPITDEMINNRKLPTKSEMALIAENADTLKLLKGEYYWTIDRFSDSSNYTYMLSGKIDYSYHTSARGRILIYRF